MSIVGVGVAFFVVSGVFGGVFLRSDLGGVSRVLSISLSDSESDTTAASVVASVVVL